MKRKYDEVDMSSRKKQKQGLSSNNGIQLPQLDDEQIPSNLMADLIKTVKILEKQIKTNREQRVKFHDNHLNFFQSECEMYATLTSLHDFTCDHSIFTEMARLRLPITLLELISHENQDVAFKAIELLWDMVDPDTNIDDNFYKMMVEQIITLNTYDLIVHYLQRIDYTDETGSEQLKFSLVFLEYLVEKGTNLQNIDSSNALISFLLTVLNKNYSYQPYLSDIVDTLAIMLRISEDSLSIFIKENGLELVISKLAEYRNHDPEAADEIEYMESLFDSICEVLLSEEHHSLVKEFQLMELMTYMLGTTYICRFSALKALSFYFSIESHRQDINDFVKFGGLRSLLKIFYRTKGCKRLGVTVDYIEEYSINCLCQISKYADSEVMVKYLDVIKDRKFKDIVHILDLIQKYDIRVSTLERTLKKREDELIKMGEIVDQSVHDTFYQLKLDSGLMILCQAIIIIFKLVHHDVDEINNITLNQIRKLKIDSKHVLELINNYIEYVSRISEARNDGHIEKELYGHFDNFIQINSEKFKE